MAEKRLGNIDFHYDPIADVMYCSIGPPQNAVGEEVGVGVVVRRNPETNALVGITVIGFLRRFSEMPQNSVSVPLDMPPETMA